MGHEFLFCRQCGGFRCSEEMWGIGRGPTDGTHASSGAALDDAAATVARVLGLLGVRGEEKP
ncbi:hypothetical protein GCM10027449_16830 [Sinomonas notoginsengisoli]|uniref:hypothetical protein n=1 Tax=Sinomonas notoginsengisoli TaxID=1457311 RepID=UPI001F1EBDAF|nr:hypothetical protein [Sinomonas notoginsengisoli]